MAEAFFPSHSSFELLHFNVNTRITSYTSKQSQVDFSLIVELLGMA